MMTPNEVYPELIKILDYYQQELEKYTPDQFWAKPSEREWSLGQMYEHLTVSALYFFMKRAVYCIEKRKGQVGGEKNEFGIKQFKYNSFPPIKIQIPAVLAGPEPMAKSIEEYRTILEKIKTEALPLCQLITPDNGEYKALQPAFGWLTAHEWFQLMEQHFRHHLRQKQEIEQWIENYYVHQQ